MSGARAYSLLGGTLAALIGALVLLAAADIAQAQVRPGTAEIKRVTGRVEVLRKGQTQWAPAAVGAKLAEGDEIRSFAGASAELELPDTSSLLVAENSRLTVTKLVVDAQGQTRLGIFHLAIGKVRATIAQAAITLVRARQTNFAISTPTGVAAARGTDYGVATDGVRMIVAVFRGAAIFADNATRTPVVVGVGGYSTQRGNAPPSAPVSIGALPLSVQADLPTARNADTGPGTPGAAVVASQASTRPSPTLEVVAVYVGATTKSAPAEAGALVRGLALADPGTGSAVMSAAIESGGSRDAVLAAGRGAGLSETTLAAVAAFVPPAPTPAVARPIPFVGPLLFTGLPTTVGLETALTEALLIPVSP